MLSLKMSEQSLIYELLSCELKSFLIDVPYTSVTQFYDYFDNQTADSRFGVSCVWQTYLFGQRLRAKGIEDITYYYDGRHVVLVCTIEHEQYLIDPYLLHTSPILMQWEKAKDTPYCIESFAYPYRRLTEGGYRASKFEVVLFPEAQSFRLNYKRFSPRRGHYVMARVFNMNTNRRAPDSPPAQSIVVPLLHHGEQNNLSIRIVHRHTHQIIELIYPIALFHRSPIHEEHLILRNNNGQIIQWRDKAQRNVMLNAMSDSLDTAVSNIVDFVLGGVTLYEKNAPNKIEYSPFNLQDD